MMRRLPLCLCAIAFITGFVAPPRASAQQSINFLVGGFVPVKTDRGTNDVLFRNSPFLVYDMRDFNGWTVAGEYLVGLNDFVDAGLGIGIYSRTVPTIDRDYVRPDGSEIEADLKLRIAPITATIRFLPLGHHDAITPYIGGGVGILNWRYTESGDFVQPNGSIVRGTFSGSETTVGPVILGGVRVPIGSGGIGFEIRHQSGEGNLPTDLGFDGTKINLGGFNYLATFTFGF